MKYLHICTKSNISLEYIIFMNKNFNKKEHKFLFFLEDENIQNYLIDENILILKNINFNSRKINFFFNYLLNSFILLKELNQCQRIYIHGLFEIKLVLLFFIFKKYLRKSNWIIWGGDLYSYRNRKKGFMRKIYYKIEEYVKGNFYGYITHIKQDYELAQKWYVAQGQYYDCFMYPSNLYRDFDIKEVNKKYIAIQVGNSADSSNNHFEIFEKLKKFKNIRIYCPLSYGDKIYADKVIKKGKEIFGEKFIPITKFLEYSKYLEFLSQIDIAIFAHNRQQAVGNITSLLGMKKTVYLKERVTTYSMLKELGVKVKLFDILDSLERFEDDILEKNKEIIRERFSEKRLIEEWKKIFEDWE